MSLVRRLWDNQAPVDGWPSSRTADQQIALYDAWRNGQDQTDATLRTFVFSGGRRNGRGYAADSSESFGEDETSTDMLRFLADTSSFEERCNDLLDD